MSAAPKHPKEKQRIESLRMLEILDTLPEKDFDDITLIAAQICQTPMALISLIDTDRQWFKSKVGLEGTQTARDTAFCAHAILEDSLFIIPDATKDDRFKDNPFVKAEPNIRFYAGAPLISPDGLPIGTVCVLDSKPRILTSEQKSALLALSNQVRRLLDLKSELLKSAVAQRKLEIKKTTIDNMSEGAVLYDSRGTIIDFNPAILDILGLTTAQLLKEKPFPASWKLINEDGIRLHSEQHPHLISLRTGKKQINSVIGVLTDEGIKWLKTNSVPLFLTTDNKSPSHVVSSFEDITQLKKLDSKRRHLEAHLSESAKLSTLGEMASGIAHEINNPLAIIDSWNQHLMRKLAKQGLDPDVDLKHFESIDKTCERIAKIIKSLRVYSHNAENDPVVPVLASQVIEDTLGLCQERFRQRGIEIKVICDPAMILNCRATQISQVLMSLLTNSFDAILDLPEKWIHISTLEAPEKNIVKFVDSGPGIEDSVVKKMMNPFFTTKEVGRGTGLGLSISREIMRNHGGDIHYDSSSQNTAFILTFPKP